MPEAEGMPPGRVALVTGGTRGIGFAIAEELLGAGASVLLTARKQDDLDAALEGLGAGERAMGVAGSSDDGGHRASAVASCVARFGSLDLLVNNAGTNPQYGPLVEADLGAVAKIMDVNLVAPLGWIQEAWRAWMGAHGGVVLNVASAGGLRPGAHIGAYNASKAALIHMTKQLATELAPGVRINAIAPGVVRTRFARALFEGREEEVSARYPLGRIGEPSDAAKLAVFLLSDNASWITGETVTLDGGITQRPW